MKTIPIGISDFKILIEGNYYYVDKTLLIEDLLSYGQVALMPRPRRFGKTLNLSMLKYFFEKTNDSYASLFSGLAIEKTPTFENHQGRYPVIFLSFKSIKESAWETTYEKFALVIYEEFARHRYLLTSDRMEHEEKALFNKIIERKSSRVELESSLQFLARLLFRHYKQQVIILIDEYDVPVQTAYIHGFYAEVIEFLRAFLVEALKDTAILQKGVLTGNLTLAKAGIFTGLNNLDVFNLTSVRSADRFGFTLAEIELLLAYYGYKDAQSSIKHWYNGYMFGETAGIFNPWSVLKCISNGGVLEKYWSNTSDNILLKRLLGRAQKSMKSEFENILNGSPVLMAIEESITFPELDTRPDLAWSLLLFTGYLSYKDYNVINGVKVCSLTLPNEEIKHLYFELIRSIFVDSVAGGQAEDLLEAFTTGDTEIFAELLQSFVINSMSSFDVPSNEPERSYHLFVLGILVMLQNRYTVNSNKESGLGRYDIMITPQDHTKPALVVEFKKTRKGETLEVAAQKALDQIAEKKYTAKLEKAAYPHIICYGIGCEGKQIYVKSKIC